MLRKHRTDGSQIKEYSNSFSAHLDNMSDVVLLEHTHRTLQTYAISIGEEVADTESTLKESTRIGHDRKSCAVPGRAAVSGEYQAVCVVRSNSHLPAQPSGYPNIAQAGFRSGL